MNKVLQHLRSQHQQILVMLDSNQDLLSIIKFVEEEHHPLEERDLFPHIANHPMLKEGGPLCTYFWGMEMDLKPKARAENLLHKLYTLHFPRPHSIPSFPWLTAHTPLQIPMGEHALSHELTYAIRELSHDENSPIAKEFLEPLKMEYIKLLRSHIDKEDNCLFVLCEKLLPTLVHSKDAL